MFTASARNLIHDVGLRRYDLREIQNQLASLGLSATSMGDVYATIYKAFGIDWTKDYPTPIGRPIKIANSLEDQTGTPIQEVLT